MDAVKPAKAFIYLKKNAADNNCVMQGLGGHHSAENATSTRTETAQTTFTPQSESGTFQISKRNIYSNNGPESPYVGKSSSSTFSYTIYEADVTAYDIYHVTITGAPDATEIGKDARVACTNAANQGIAKVYNGGHFFFPKGTVVTEADFTAQDLGFMNVGISIVDKEITVTYSEVTDVEDAKNVAQRILTRRGVGYPKLNGDSYNTLKTAIESATSVEDIQNAYNAYKAATDIEYPEDGKTYTFSNVHSAFNTRLYLAFNESGVPSVTTYPTSTTAESLPQNAKFTCHVLDEANHKYIFVTDRGQYLRWGAINTSGTINKGGAAENSYNETYSYLNISKMLTSAYTGNASSDADLFGYVKIGGYRSDVTGNFSNFVIKDDLSFGFANDASFFKSDYSTAFIIEEVPYGNEATLKVPATPKADETSLAYASIYLPFATTIPEGVTAYTGSVVEGADGEELQLSEVTGSYLPANTAAVLTSETAGNYTFVPTEQTVNEISGNALSGRTITTGDTPEEGPTYYILNGAQGHEIGFSKYIGATLPKYKALLELGSESSVKSLALTLGDGTTGIETAVTAAGSEKAYDLSGRRVTKATKGLYIVNGKKILVK